MYRTQREDKELKRLGDWGKGGKRDGVPEEENEWRTVETGVRR